MRSLQKMLRFYCTVCPMMLLVFSLQSCNTECTGVASTKATVDTLVSQIALAETFDSEYIGEGGERSPQYKRFLELQEKVTTRTLVALTQHESPAVKAYALLGLGLRDTVEFEARRDSLRADKSILTVRSGCLEYSVYIVHAVRDEMDFYAAKRNQNRAKLKETNPSSSISRDDVSFDTTIVESIAQEISKHGEVHNSMIGYGASRSKQYMRSLHLAAYSSQSQLLKFAQDTSPALRVISAIALIHRKDPNASFVREHLSSDTNRVTYVSGCMAGDSRVCYVLDRELQWFFP